MVAITLFVLCVVALPASSQSSVSIDGYRWVRPAAVNLREGPGTQLNVIRQLRRGERVWLVYVDQGWAEVQIPIEEGWEVGWIRFDLLAETDPTDYKRGNSGDRARDNSRDHTRDNSRNYGRGPEAGSGGILVVLILGGVFLVIILVVSRRSRAPRISKFQNRGEARLSRLLQRRFRPPDYHLLNHITLRLGESTTQIDHILVSRFGVFVIETKDYSGWIFGSPENRQWTQVLYEQRFGFQNPILQNRRHVRAVENLLDFLPSGAVSSVVVFVGAGELKTPMPQFVLYLSEVVQYIRKQSTVIMSDSQLQLCLDRLETERLEVTVETDLEHIRNVQRWHGSGG